MKLTGFIKEYNDISEAINFNALLGTEIQTDQELKNIITYLKQGYLLLSWMGYFIDFNSKELIAPDSYYTDGIWVWPAYLPYYVNRYPNFILDPAFKAHLKNRNFTFDITADFEINRRTYEDELSKKLGGIHF